MFKKLTFLIKKVDREKVCDHFITFNIQNIHQKSFKVNFSPSSSTFFKQRTIIKLEYLLLEQVTKKKNFISPKELKGQLNYLFIYSRTLYLEE